MCQHMSRHADQLMSAHARARERKSQAISYKLTVARVCVCVLVLNENRVLKFKYALDRFSAVYRFQ